MFLITPGTVVNHAIEAHRSLGEGSVRFELNSHVRDRVAKLRGSIDFRKNQALTVSIEDLSPGHRSSRVYHIEGHSFSAYDRFSDEALKRSVPETRSPAGRLAFVIGSVPDPVMAVGDPNWMGGFLRGLSKINRYHVAAYTNGPTLTSPAAKGGDKTELQFEKHGLLHSFTSAKGAAKFQWSLTYSPTYHPFHIPEGAALVSAFHEHAPPPNYATPEARSLSLAVLRAARRMKPSKIMVKRPDRQTAIYWDRGKIRQNNPHSSWAYDGNILSVSVGKSFYRGKATRADVLDYLAALTNGEDSLARTFLLQSNPLDDFFETNCVVRIAGKVNIRGVPSTILKITGPASNSSIIVENSNHLVESMETDTIGTAGRVAFRDEADYVYQPLPDHAASLFEPQTPAHATPRKLPKSAIKFSPKNLPVKTQYGRGPGR